MRNISTSLYQTKYVNTLQTDLSRFSFQTLTLQCLYKYTHSSLQSRFRTSSLSMNPSLAADTRWSHLFRSPHNCWQHSNHSYRKTPHASFRGRWPSRWVVIGNGKYEPINAYRGLISSLNHRTWMICRLGAETDNMASARVAVSSHHTGIRRSSSVPRYKNTQQ